MIGLRGIRAKDQYEKGILDRINQLSVNRQTWQVWSDLICATACSLANVTDKDPARWESREKEYESCIKRLGGVDTAAEVFALIVEALEHNPWQDLLGDLYMRLNLGSHWHGQFFTPFSICRMTARICIPDKSIERIREKGWISVSDPAIGGGAMLIAAAEEFHTQKINYQNHVLFAGQDIDRIAGLMANIQLSLLGCPGYIVIGDTITNPMTGHVLFPQIREGQEYWFTPMFFSDVWQSRRMCIQLDSYISRTATNNEKPKQDSTIVFIRLGAEEDIMAETKIDEKTKLSFDTGVEKLRHEQEECLKNVPDDYKDMVSAQYAILFDAVVKRCEEDQELDALVLQEHKGWGRCMKYLSDQAMKVTNATEEQRQKARSGEQPIAVPVGLETITKWCEDYYRLDDKKEVEKERKKAEKDAAKRKQAATAKAAPSKSGNAQQNVKNAHPDEKMHKPERKSAENEANKSDAKKKKPKQKKTAVPDGQLSLFDFM